MPEPTVTSDTPRPSNGMTDKEIQKTLAGLGRRKKDPEQVEQAIRDLEEVRRRINAQELHEMERMEKEKNMEDSIFARIARGDVPVEKIYETDHVVAFKDISPQAPVHALVIPKQPFVSVAEFKENDTDVAGALLVACAEVARCLGVDKTGFRVVFNSGSDGGQTVPYLHAHLLGGRPMEWPPG